MDKQTIKDLTAAYRTIEDVHLSDPPRSVSVPLERAISSLNLALRRARALVGAAEVVERAVGEEQEKEVTSPSATVQEFVQALPRWPDAS